MLKLLLVGSGGFLGSVARYLLSDYIATLLSKPLLPFGTLAVNVLGCLVIGLLGGLSEARQVLTPETRLLLMIGFLGGFTTFSSFGYEILNYARDGQIAASLASLGLHIFLGLGAVWSGLTLSQLI